MTMCLDPVEDAVAAIRAGRPVVVLDDEDREGEGDLIFAAEAVSVELIRLMIVECRGLICVPMAGPLLDRLDLRPMVETNTERHGTAFTVSVDASTGITTGISARDRVRTIRTLCDPSAEPTDLARPGHVFPLRAAEGGVLSRRGHTEAAVDLARLAGRIPAGVICEILGVDGCLMRPEELRQFANSLEVSMIHVRDLMALLEAEGAASGAPPRAAV